MKSLRVSIRSWLVLAAVVMLLVAVAAVLRGMGRLHLFLGPDSRERGSPGGIEYQPVELDPGTRYRLVVWDYPWPHENPMENPDRFFGEQPVLWRQRLARAVAAFQRAYPNVEVVVEELSFAGDWRAAGDRPDILAVWWNTPGPDPAEVVPISPYLTDEIRAEYHPLAWQLQEREGIAQGWPRWIAFHYWFAVAAGDDGGEAEWAGILENGWTWDDALRRLGDAGILLTPPASPGLWLDLLAVAGDVGGGGGRAGMNQVVAGMMQTLQAKLAPSDLRNRLGQDLINREFTLAGGFNPAFAHWALSLPWSRRTDVRPDDLVLLPPPVLTGSPTPLPVFSLGTYVVLRKSGSGELERAQLAMELARHLSRWEPEWAVHRLLAIPAYRPGIQRWHTSYTLSEDIRKRLLDDAARAILYPARLYATKAGQPGKLDPTQLGDLFVQWLAGDVDQEEVVERLTEAVAGGVGSQEGINTPY